MKKPDFKAINSLKGRKQNSLQRIFLEKAQKPLIEAKKVLHHEEVQPKPPRKVIYKANNNDLCPCGSGKKFKHCHK